uniref:Transposase n=1 Tax=Acidobacterium capsulatum TaxID=33075 RepID=A0A7V4XSN9_9BACT
MPRGLERLHCTGHFHFLTFSCYQRQPFFGNAAACDLFEDALERTRERFRWLISGYVVMPEHVHLVVNEPEIHGTLADAVKGLKLSVTLRQNRRPFWQARYYDFNLFTEAKHSEKLRYLHRNPVTRGLVAKPEDWRWSSFRHHSTGVQGVVQVESWWSFVERERRERESRVRTDGPGAPGFS